jgi:hypothetical protein
MQATGNMKESTAKALSNGLREKFMWETGKMAKNTAEDCADSRTARFTMETGRMANKVGMNYFVEPDEAGPLNKSVYLGDWKEGLKRIKGECMLSDRGFYKGDWKEGKEHGWEFWNEMKFRVLKKAELLVVKGNLWKGNRRGTVSAHGRGLAITVRENGEREIEKDMESLSILKRARKQAVYVMV